MKTVLGLLFFICLDIPAFAGYKTIGFKTSTLSDRQTDRPLELVVWYPSTTTAPPQLIADTPVFSGDLAVVILTKSSNFWLVDNLGISMVCVPVGSRILIFTWCFRGEGLVELERCY